MGGQARGTQQRPSVAAYSCMQGLLTQRFLPEVHQLLKQRSGPYEGVCTAYGLQAGQLDGVVQRYLSGQRYIEVSASFACSDPARFASCAPVLFDGSSRGRNSDGLCVDTTLMDSNAALQQEYSAALVKYIATNKGKLQPPGGYFEVWFRLSAAQAALPLGSATPWVPCRGGVDAATCEAIHSKARCL